MPSSPPQQAALDDSHLCDLAGGGLLLCPGPLLVRLRVATLHLVAHTHLHYPKDLAYQHHSGYIMNVETESRIDH